MSILLAPRYAALRRLLLLVVVLALGLRLALLLWVATAGTPPGGVEIIRALLNGTVYDLALATYWLIPFVLLTVLPRPRTRPAGRAFRLATYVLYGAAAGLLVFDLVAEWLFWDEFGVRYNFIAVDYLVYTNEVVGNIRESYPLHVLIPAVLLVAGAAYWWWLRPGVQRSFAVEPEQPQRGWAALALLGLPLLMTLGLDAGSLRIPASATADELGHNGIYQLFAAFRNNQLDYDSFYLAEKNDDEALRRVRPLLASAGDTFVHPGDIHDIRRHVGATGPPQRRNIVWITVESLSADFLTRYGSTAHITPNLDSLLEQSLAFDDLYATGTRTIRGLEALTLCLPPTPGYSIVKRPHNENLFSSGTLLRATGYQTRFLYGGYGYFDNMNYFFGNNGFTVTDRADFPAEAITFANNWGVCDEDLFGKALQQADADARTGQPFYYFLMTTSNHRPFTYPEGRIDIPSHSGRDGAVKYTDFAIGKFIREARQKPWFANTVFVVVADHCASSAGKTEVPVARYHIPGFVYAPGFVQPRHYAGLMSQIDMVPTVLGLLNLSYDTKFFGQNVLHTAPNRAFVGTYQQVGLLRDGRLTVLSPKRGVESFAYTLNQPDSQHPSKPNPADVRAAEDYYQSAYWLFNSGGYAAPTVTAKSGTAAGRL
jgi:phosphoglycerol transferase MdoB-like AlkP superfamily enzyme